MQPLSSQNVLPVCSAIMQKQGWKLCPRNVLPVKMRTETCVPPGTFPDWCNPEHVYTGPMWKMYKMNWTLPASPPPPPPIRNLPPGLSSALRVQLFVSSLKHRKAPPFLIYSPQVEK